MIKRLIQSKYSKAQLQDLQYQIFFGDETPWSALRKGDDWRKGRVDPLLYVDLGSKYLIPAWLWPYTKSIVCITNRIQSIPIKQFGVFLSCDPLWSSMLHMAIYCSCTLAVVMWCHIMECQSGLCGRVDAALHDHQHLLNLYDELWTNAALVATRPANGLPFHPSCFHMILLCPQITPDSWQYGIKFVWTIYSETESVKKCWHQLSTCERQ